LTIHGPRHRQQVRNFALIWTGVTLLVGALTFIAIYATTAPASSNRGFVPAGIVAQTSGTPDSTLVEAVALQVTATPADNTQPTSVPPTAAPAQPANAQATQPATQAVQPTATINPILDKDFDLGIAVQDNPDPNTYKVWVDMVRNQLRLNWVKSQVIWRDVEVVKGKIDWTAMDVSINMMHDAGVKVMLSIAKAPNWARDKGAPTNKPGQYDGPPSNPQDYADFLTAVIKRYPGKINAIEVWNEVNLDREWSTAPQAIDAKRYVALLTAAHDAIKAQDPNIIVITAALSPTGADNTTNYKDDFRYMNELIAAGMLQHADCVGAHHNGLNVPPTADYKLIPERKPRATFRGPWDNPNHSWSFKSTLEGYAGKIKAAGSDLKLCVTEFGWPSAQGLTKGKPRAGFEFANDNTLSDQADFTDQALTEMQQWGFVRLAFLFNLNYGPQVGWSMDGAVGDNVLWCIIGQDWATRPVWQKVVDRNFKGQPRKASA